MTHTNVLELQMKTMQGTKLTFLARRRLAPKFSKVVAKAKKSGAIKKKKIVKKTHYTVASNGKVFLASKWSACATKKDISLHNIRINIWKIQDDGCWHVRFIAFVTILLNRPYHSRRFIYFKASFSCQKHQGKIYKTQSILVANLATNFWILVASTIILVALATVLGAISCPAMEKNLDIALPKDQVLALPEALLYYGIDQVP